MRHSLSFLQSCTARAPRGILQYLVAAVLLFVAQAGRAEQIRVQSTAIAARALSTIAGQLRNEGIELKINTEGGSGVAVASVSTGSADAAIIVRRVTAQERSNAPTKRLIEETVAYQALALIVPADVWGSGVKAISKDQMTDVYEGRIKNWKELGGEDRPIKFFNPEQGQGLWEPLVTWLYGDMRRAGLGVQFEKVRSGEEARDSVEFVAGSIGLAPIQYANGRGLFALSLGGESGAPVAPTVEEIVAGRYPLARPVVAVVGDKPTGNLRRFIDYLRGPEAQEIFNKAGLLPGATPVAPEL